MSKASILLIYTGGTIGMVNDPKTGRLKPFNFSKLLQEVPELKRFHVNIDTFSFEQPIDSSNMQPHVWIDLANIIAKNYRKYDGFVILHGTDTMGYTASALSFMLENLGKPVILTGSQLPIGTIRTDGKENLITAIEIAAGGKVNEVCVYFEFCLYRGNRTRKFSAEQFRAFQSPNYPALADAGVHLKYNKNFLQPKPKGKFSVRAKLDENVAILKLFPGIHPSVVKAMLGIKGLRGLVLETFGAGNATSQKWFLEELRKAAKKGLIILNITQCDAGSVDQGRYETSSGLAKSGVIGGGDMTTEAAVTKLMYLFATEKNVEGVRKKLALNMRGEMS